MYKQRYAESEKDVFKAAKREEELEQKYSAFEAIAKRQIKVLEEKLRDTEKS